MGFEIDSIKMALEISNNDVTVATQYLIEGIDLNQSQKAVI